MLSCFCPACSIICASYFYFLNSLYLRNSSPSPTTLRLSSLPKCSGSSLIFMILSLSKRTIKWRRNYWSFQSSRRGSRLCRRCWWIECAGYWTQVCCLQQCLSEGSWLTPNRSQRKVSSVCAYHLGSFSIFLYQGNLPHHLFLGKARPFSWLRNSFSFFR